ncbi:hypothetical protein BC833DRAFT_625851 [Globomyces pollinis-pini]|nr:hypothetical protein BC833DRAFT_625851 [Globomyces pollinis-pini]
MSQYDDEINAILQSGNLSAKSLKAYKAKVTTYRNWLIEHAPEEHNDCSMITDQSYFGTNSNRAGLVLQVLPQFWATWNSQSHEGNPAMSDQVKSLLKAYQIEGRDVQVKRSQPMDYNTLGFLCYALKRSNMQDTEKLKYQSLFTLAWYCWLRVDETLTLSFAT